MKIICFVKLVPDVENFKYDYERNVLVRENVHQILNPEDCSALSVALKLKQENIDVQVETLTMGPEGCRPHLEDLIKRGVDRSILISDKSYVGSDTYVTSRIISRYLEREAFDWIFSGTHSIDGGTAHVPSQVAECLNIPQMGNILRINQAGLFSDRVRTEVDSEDAVLQFEIERPAILSFQYSTKIKLPYIKYEDLERDVSGQLEIVSNSRLRFCDTETGIAGSPTKVSQVEVDSFGRKDTRFLKCDDEGIEEVYQFLKQRGIVCS
ncbi:MAG: hypothetical protein PQJ61_09315 [Spirochaetales bacterium]|uniref:Electron transfer flavoprotein alpha/beta-subunit N-terminal domain-containing protein n=1 Tax=Candidatus Thalassospirochaeta sargassi TaxID=3119039 RepID=A0AAJ1ICZ5_9SPIO|nr:hypothetical protein [Spirochaetales bacterium]